MAGSVWRCSARLQHCTSLGPDARGGAKWDEARGRGGPPRAAHTSRVGPLRLLGVHAPRLALGWAGYAAAHLPPAELEPIGLSFVGASMASPGAMESFEHRLPKDHPLRALFLADRPGDKPDWTYNLLLKHGVRACPEYARSFDVKKAHAVSNPDLAPHLEFVDMGGHGYATVRLTADALRTEFVCIPRPITRSDRPDGGPLRYRVAHAASLWKPGERPVLRQQVIEGDVGLST